MMTAVRFGCKTAVILAVVLVLAGAVEAAPENPFSSIIGEPWYSNTLVAEVTWTGEYFHYEYTLDFYQTRNGSPLTAFSVGNLSNLEFLNAGNDGGFANPVYGQTSNDSVLWQNGSVDVGRIVKFWYDSPYSFDLVNATMSAGLPGSAETLGMTPVPEPGSLILMGTGLVSILGLRRRKA